MNEEETEKKDRKTLALGRKVLKRIAKNHGVSLEDVSEPMAAVEK